VETDVIGSLEAYRTRDAPPVTHRFNHLNDNPMALEFAFRSSQDCSNVIPIEASVTMDR
jgi:hypothetical protein